MPLLSGKMRQQLAYMYYGRCTSDLQVSDMANSNLATGQMFHVGKQWNWEFHTVQQKLLLCIY